jgi:RND family efflux transporter MFP subunit
MKKRLWISLIVLVLLAAAGGGGFWAYKRYFTRPSTAQTQTLQTATVSQGDMVITADGTGNLLPSAEKTLSFRVSGTVAEVNVKVGDKVKAGDVLAKLDTLDLDNAIREATYTLEQARLALQKAQRKAESGTDLAVAAKSLESARLGIVSAQGSYSSTLLTDITVELQKAKFWDDYWQSELGDAWLALQQNPNSDNRKIHYADMGARAADAHATYVSLQQEADNNKTAAKRSLVSAQQSYLSALSSYNDTKYSDPVKEAELTVLQAETKLTQAQEDLQNATLVAPISGTITAVTLETGNSGGSDTSAGSITISDLDTPEVRFYVEESDLGKVVVGNAVSMTFESLSDRAFTGKIVRVEPALVTEGNTQAVEAYASVDRPAQPVAFLSGMSAEVVVIAQETHNAALVPLEALRELATGQYSVFVVKDDGTLELRLVQVGLKDLVNAEITSGVTPGEMVSLGTQTTSQTTKTSTRSSTSGQQQGGMGGPMDGGFGGPPPGGMP